MLRDGMLNLVARWRRMVDDVGQTVWDTSAAQELLDAHRYDFYAEPLAVQDQQLAPGTVVYHLYQSAYRNLEEVASGTTAWRLYDALGNTYGTADATIDYQRGEIRFNVDQRGSARYLDGRSYNLYAAAADAWRERAGLQSSGYDFSTDGQSFHRSQWFEHCTRMAEYYDNLGATTDSGGSPTGGFTIVERSDLA